MSTKLAITYKDIPFEFDEQRYSWELAGDDPLGVGSMMKDALNTATPETFEGMAGDEYREATDPDNLHAAFVAQIQIQLRDVELVSVPEPSAPSKGVLV